MSARSESLSIAMHAEELRQSWQGRALALTARESPKLCRVLMSVCAENYDEDNTNMFLLHAVFGTSAVLTPYFCTAARIDKAGQVVADVQCKGEAKEKNYVIFKDEDQMQGIFRKLADKMKLSDADRIDLFIAVRFWVKADFRLDPTMDRADPDAKRLTVH